MPCHEVISPAMKPGLIALRRMPKGGTSTATFFIRPMTPAFAAV
ncbi:hypothetical protein [Nonomuraea rubra]